VRPVNHQLVDVPDQALLPQAVVDDQGTEAYHLLILDSAEILVVLRPHAMLQAALHVRRVHFNFRPQLGQQLADTFIVCGYAIANFHGSLSKSVA
jgi:hypothetical protein